MDSRKQLVADSNHSPAADTTPDGGEAERVTWASKVDFILTCIGWCVGLSNVWRFPYLCYNNGGGAFLLPYVLTLLCCGLPLACLEFVIGQYVGLGALPFWKISPLFKGVGFSFVIMNVIVSIYYIIVISYAIFYFVCSFSAELPWSHCGNPWNTEHCVDWRMDNVTEAAGNVTGLVVGSNSTGPAHPAGAGNGSRALEMTPAEEFFSHGVLHMSSGIDDLGAVRWPLLLCLLAAWVMVYFATIRGIRSSGKVAYFTATFPYIMLTILVVRGAMLPGSLEGIKFYLTPDWSRLGESQVWYAAALQIFYSVGPAWGGFITLSSYNDFHNNCLRDAVITVSVNCFTSLYAGFAVFSVLGFMAANMGVSVTDVVKSGPGLAFVAYPGALATMPLSQLWSVLFFAMLILLGIGSELVHFETIISCMVDEFPLLRKNHRVRAIFSGCTAAALFLIGILFITRGGMYIFTLVDWYSTAFTLMLVAIIECAVFAYIYGLERLETNMKEMFGFGPNWYFKVCWKVLSPLFVVVIIAFSIMTWAPVSLGAYEYPAVANTAGWVLAALPFSPIPVVAVYVLATAPAGGSLLQRLRASVLPSDEFRGHVERRLKEAKARRLAKETEEGEEEQAV